VLAFHALAAFSGVFEWHFTVAFLLALEEVDVGILVFKLFLVLFYFFVEFVNEVIFLILIIFRRFNLRTSQRRCL